MKKLTYLLQMTYFICFSTTVAVSQLFAEQETETSIIENAKMIIDYDLTKEKKFYKFLGFGSFIEPSTNMLNIVPKDGSVYTKAELLNTETKKTVKTIQLDKSKNVIDLTGVQQGNYILILTNSTGKINVEKLTII